MSAARWPLRTLPLFTAERHFGHQPFSSPGTLPSHTPKHTHTLARANTHTHTLDWLSRSKCSMQRKTWDVQMDEGGKKEGRGHGVRGMTAWSYAPLDWVSVWLVSQRNKQGSVGCESPPDSSLRALGQTRTLWAGPQTSVGLGES